MNTEFVSTHYTIYGDQMNSETLLPPIKYQILEKLYKWILFSTKMGENISSNKTGERKI